jgi:hypothetical protein
MTLYKFRNPSTPDEALERFRLVEYRGDRMLVEFVCSMAIPPQFVYPSADLVEDDYQPFWHCVDCGREYDDIDDGPCPSDDCPSRDVTC